MMKGRLLGAAYGQTGAVGTFEAGAACRTVQLMHPRAHRRADTGPGPAQQVAITAFFIVTFHFVEKAVALLL